MSFDKIKQMSEPKSKAKSTVKQIVDESMEESCNQLIEATNQFKNAEALMNNCKQKVVEYFKQIHHNFLKDKQINKSYQLNDKITCSFTDRFSSFTEHDINDIKQRLTEPEKFSKLFIEKASIELQDHIKHDEQKVNELISKLEQVLTADQIKQYFKFNVTIVPVEQLEKVAVIENQYDNLEDIIDRLRYSPSIKIN